MGASARSFSQAACPEAFRTSWEVSHFLMTPCPHRTMGSREVPGARAAAQAEVPAKAPFPSPLPSCWLAEALSCSWACGRRFSTSGNQVRKGHIHEEG
jgi:hypothetical protein